MISVITVVKNGANTISECIKSVSNQSEKHEHFIVDGDSTDATLEIINDTYSQNVRIISEKDESIYDAMNKGIRKSSGDIIGILNADDLLHDQDVLNRVARVFHNKATHACYGDLVYVARTNTDRVKRYWRSGKFSPQKMYWGWMPPHPTFFVRRSVYDNYGLFDQSLGSSADYELMLRFLLKYQIAVKYIPKIMVKMRIGGQSNASLKIRLHANSMDRKAWRVNRLTPYPWTILFKPLRKLPQYWQRPKYKKYPSSDIN
jgi:glycosyltransferase involved in cell wall biosynthesis